VIWGGRNCPPLTSQEGLHLSQMMMDQALKILRAVPGLRAACADRTNKVQRSCRAIQEVGVYFNDQFVCKIDQNYMDEVPHQEWLTSQTEIRPGTLIQGTAYQYHRSAWPERMEIIERALPHELKPLLRKAAWRVGSFKWKKN